MATLHPQGLMSRKAMVLTRPEDHEDKISIDFYFENLKEEV